MELIPITAVVHYKAAFDIEANSKDLMTELRKIVRSWCLNLTKGEKNEHLHSGWFFKGIKGVQKIGKFQFRVAINKMPESPSPSHWGLEVIHPDSDFSSRLWSVEITLTQNKAGSVRFVSIVKNWIREGYIGKVLPLPNFTTPKYLKKIIGNNKLICKRGGTRILNIPTSVTEENYVELIDEIKRLDRYLPLIVISRSKFNDTKYCVNHKEIQKKILGNANIYLLESKNVASLVNDALGKDYSCLWGTMRIYMPKVDLTKHYLSKFHRYYIPNIQEEKIVEEVAVGLSRNCKTFLPREILSIQHVLHEIQRSKIEGLRKSKDSLTKEQDGWIDELSSELAKNETLLQQLEIQSESIESIEQEKQAMQAEIDSLKHQLNKSKGSSASDIKLINFLKKMERIPSNLEDVVNLICRVYSDRIRFTKEGLKSAKRYKYSKKIAPDSWRLLRAMAVNLHPMFFSDQPQNIEQKFNDETKFELSMKEGRQTNKDSSFLKLRKIKYKGREIDITPHVKFGTRGPKLLRVYFCPDEESQLLIVGHCGGHLENFSTKNS